MSGTSIKQHNLTPEQLWVHVAQPKGLLPYWLLITALASVYNVVQNYVTLKQSKEVYAGKPNEGELDANGSSLVRHSSTIAFQPIVADDFRRVQLAVQHLPIFTVHRSPNNSDTTRRPPLWRLDSNGSGCPFPRSHQHREPTVRKVVELADCRLYDLAICAFGVATFHFTTEWLIFGTVKLNRASIGPLIVGCEFGSA